MPETKTESQNSGTPPVQTGTLPASTDGTGISAGISVNGNGASPNGSSGTGGTPVSTKSHEEELAKIQFEQKEKAIQARAKELNLPYIDLTKFPVNPDVLHAVSPEDAKRALLMPFFRMGKNLRVAVSAPDQPATKEILERLRQAGFECQINLATEEAILEVQKLYQSEQYRPAEEVKVDVSGEQKFYEQELKSLSALKEKIEILPAEEALAALHAGIMKTGASDAHYQPEADFCSIRFRIDGVLRKVFDISRAAYAAILNQLKYKAKMKLNITNVPQDGRYFFKVDDRKIDVRVAVIPTEFGESVSCRILDTGKRFESFEELGFLGRSLEVLQATTKLSYGMVLVTGPTGSGKTTTLYALLKHFNQPGEKIITLEDPIEYHLPGLVQSQIDEKREYTFASGMRSILRHDPDVIMIGEIRDLDTAQAACQAALTGHVLLSTLHTNSALETIPRLLTIGVAPFVIAPSLYTIVAQRLVRRVCEKCVREKKFSEQEKKLFEEVPGLPIPETGREGRGCEECSQTGYRGRFIISEVVVVDAAMREAILNGAPEAKFHELARTQGMITIREDGIMKVAKGLTTFEEVFRVVSGGGG